MIPDLCGATWILACCAAGCYENSKRLGQWAYLNGVELDFSRRGKPTDNGLIEAFNGRLRQECLNESWFLSLEYACEKTETWRKYYNSERPHGALGNLPPLEYVSLVK